MNKLQAFKILIEQQVNKAVPEAVTMDLIIAYQEMVPLLVDVADEAEATLNMLVFQGNKHRQVDSLRDALAPLKGSA